MIAYHILCHGNFTQVAMLIDALNDEDATFLIDIDDGKNPNTRAIKRFESLPNVHITRDANIGWGAGGTLRKTLRGAFRLLELSQDWDYYVVLSGQDLPLKSNAQIKDFLARGHTHQISYIRSFQTDLLEVADLSIANPKKECRLWGDRGHTKIFAKPGAIDPQVNMGARWLVDVCEIGEKGEVYVGTCDQILLKRRTEFFSRYPFYTGANWFNLHRSLLEYMATDPFTYELYDVLRTTFIPDESFFQTYIMNSPFREKVSMDYGRLILRPGPVPKVKVFGMEDLTTIEGCSELYGRKFDIQHDKNIVKRVLRMVA